MAELFLTTKQNIAKHLKSIFAVGYRARSPRGVQFRRWASTVRTLAHLSDKGSAFTGINLGVVVSSGRGSKLRCGSRKNPSPFQLPKD